MSIINKKLQSVTQRNRNPRVKPSLNRSQKAHKPLLLGGIMAIFCLLVFTGFWLYTKTHKTHTPPVDNQPIEPVQEIIKEIPEKTLTVKADTAKKEPLDPTPQSEEVLQKETKTFERPTRPSKRHLRVKNRPKRTLPPQALKTKNIEQPKPLNNPLSKTVKAPKTVQKNNHHLLVLYEKANTLLAKGRLDKAIHLLSSQDLEKATQGHSGLTLARALIQKHNTAHAQEVLQRIAKLYGAIKPKALLLMAHIHWQEKQYQKSADVLMGHMPPINEHEDYYSFLAQAYLRIGKHDLASTIYHKLLEHNTLNARWWLGLGMAHQGLKHYDQAKEDFEKAAQYEKDNLKLKALAQSKIQEVENLKHQTLEIASRENTTHS